MTTTQPAPQQEAQEPYAYAVYFPDQPKVELVHELDDLIDDLTNRPHVVTKLYTAPQLSPTAQADSVQEDAARLDWLEQHDGRYYNLDKVASIVGTGFLAQSEGNMPQVHSTLREAVDAARKQGENHDR